MTGTVLEADPQAFDPPENDDSVSFDGGSAASGRHYSIGDVSEAVGIPVPTLRSWERRYGFPEPIRTEGGHRRYSDVHLNELRRVRDAINPGGRRVADAIRHVVSSRRSKKTRR